MKHLLTRLFRIPPRPEKSSLRTEPGCCLEIHPTALVEGNIRISGGSELRIGAECRLRGVDLLVTGRGLVEIRPGAILDYTTCPHPASIVVHEGHLRIDERVNLKCSILVRFGGRLEIGTHTGIGHGTEIRCEESILIGRYCLVSYDVCIYDTNTHSADWRQRRERIEQGYPHGAAEHKRPRTRPVVIGDDVWIGKRAMIAKGTCLGDRTIVGMGAVVSGLQTPPDARVVAGPPRVITSQSNQGEVS